MSYDLWFWRQVKPLSLSPDAICQELSEDRAVDGIATLPIDRIKQAILAEFPDIEDGPTSLSWEGDGSYFEVSWPPDSSHVAVSCGYKLLKNPDALNRLIELMANFGCALYDSQTGERYQQGEPPSS